MFCPIQTNIFNIFMMYENRKFSYIREVRLHLDISTFLNSGETPQVCENPSPAPTLYTSTPPQARDWYTTCSASSTSTVQKLEISASGDVHSVKRNRILVYIHIQVLWWRSGV